jgi:alanine racemase
MPPFPTTRAEISRSRLIANFSRLRSLVRRASPAADLLAVIKADAYGHGIAHCAPWLVEAGADWLGVTSPEEGVAVRQLCPGARILVMRGLLPGEADNVLDARLTPTVWDPEHLHLLEAAIRRRPAVPAGVPVHLEMDTGMSRQGLPCGPREIAGFLDHLGKLPALRLDGVYTHFASPENLDAEQTGQQWSRLRQAVEQIAASGFHPQWLHAGNSSTALGQQTVAPLAALAASVGARCMVRPGIALYGYATRFSGEQADAAEAERVALQPVLSWKTAIASLRTVEAGASIGYNATFTAVKAMRLALLPVGYADGLNRKLSGQAACSGGHVLVRGVAAPIVGRISMDLTVIDGTHLPEVAIGEEVVLLGEQNGQRVTADDHARWAQTIPYEILCAIAARVPRMPCG